MCAEEIDVTQETSWRDLFQQLSAGNKPAKFRVALMEWMSLYLVCIGYKNYLWRISIQVIVNCFFTLNSTARVIDQYRFE
jgi:antibiotic biosynthesis monooxygenase (ABM) superfamily enzyme